MHVLSFLHDRIHMLSSVKKKKKRLCSGFGRGHKGSIFNLTLAKRQRSKGLRRKSPSWHHSRNISVKAGTLLSSLLSGWVKPSPCCETSRQFQPLTHCYLLRSWRHPPSLTFFFTQVGLRSSCFTTCTRYANSVHSFKNDFRVYVSKTKPTISQCILSWSIKFSP